MGSRLTKANVEKMKPAATGQHVVRDGELPSFFIVVGKTAKTYTAQCDLRHGKKRSPIRVALGRHPDIDAGTARGRARAVLGRVSRYNREARREMSAVELERAKHVLRAIAAGEDATEFDAADAEGPTLAEAWASYKDALVKKSRSPGTIANYEDTAARLLAKWRDTPLAALGNDRAAVAAEHRRLTDERGAYAANNAMRVFRAIYNHARRTWTQLPESPTNAVDFNKESRRNTALGTGDLPKWYSELLKLSNPIRREMHLFTLLSGLRKNDVLTLRWADLDVKGRRFTIPSPKGGARKAFDLPLSRPMLRCLWRAKRAGAFYYPKQARTWVFPADSPAGHVVEIKEKGRLGATGHALRHTFATLAEAAGLSPFFTKVLMNHSVGGDITAGYKTVDALFPQLLAEQERLSNFIMHSLGEGV